MNSNWIEIVGMVGGSATVTALIGRWRSKSDQKRAIAETQNVISTTYDRLISRMQEEIKRLGDSMDRMYEREKHYLAANTSLMSDKQDLLKRVQKLENDREKLRDELEIFKRKS